MWANKEYYKWYIDVYITIAVINSLYCIAEIYFAINGMNISSLLFGRYSFYTEPYEWGSYFRARGLSGINLTGISITISIFLVNISSYAKYHAVIMPVFIVGLMLTQSRSAVISFVIGALYLLIKNYKNKVILIYLCLMILAFVSVGILFPDELIKIILEREFSVESNNRTEIYKVIENMDIIRFLTGYGIGQYSESITNGLIASQIGINIEDFRNPHNSYLLIFYESGLIGILLYLFYFITLLSKKIKKNGRSDVYASSAMIAILVSSVFNQNLEINFIFMTYILLGIYKNKIKDNY
jgi:O-antigen ligase